MLGLEIRSYSARSDLKNKSARSSGTLGIYQRRGIGVGVKGVAGSDAIVAQ